MSIRSLLVTSLILNAIGAAALMLKETGGDLQKQDPEVQTGAETTVPGAPPQKSAARESGKPGTKVPESAEQPALRMPVKAAGMAVRGVFHADWLDPEVAEALKLTPEEKARVEELRLDIRKKRMPALELASAKMEGGREPKITLQVTEAQLAAMQEEIRMQMAEMIGAERGDLLTLAMFAYHESMSLASSFRFIRDGEKVWVAASGATGYLPRQTPAGPGYLLPDDAERLRGAGACGTMKSKEVAAFLQEQGINISGEVSLSPFGN